MPLGSNNSRRLGTVCRIYKNSASKVIALESVEVTIDILQKADKTFHRSVNTVNVSRRLVHLQLGGSRVIASVQAIGSYSSIEENGGNYLVATWAKKSDNENDVVISLEGYVAVVGDTV